MDALVFSTEYLNRSPNKNNRRSSAIYCAVLWHETASPNPDNPRGTLNFNLSRDVGSSYHYLIARTGDIFAYVDPIAYTAWHAGKSTLVVDGATYKDFAVSEATIGIEIDGRNNGESLTAYQLDSAARLALFCEEAFGIPLDREHHVTHAQVAPGRKTDPKCTTPEAILKRAAELQALDEPPPAAPAIDYAVLYGTQATFDPAWRMPKKWLEHYQVLGKALASAYPTPFGIAQDYENGYIRWTEAGGAVAYLPEDV